MYNFGFWGLTNIKHQRFSFTANTAVAIFRVIVLVQLLEAVTYTWAVKNFDEFPHSWRMRDKMG
jgi:hypothetical protein